jgi:hypothetical protein
MDSVDMNKIGLKTKSKYSLSFTAASALIPETVSIAQIMLEEKDWELVFDRVSMENLLNKNKSTTLSREFNEIKKRLKNLNQQELEILANSNTQLTKWIIHLSLLKTYSFYSEFVCEVIRGKLNKFELSIKNSDYTRFYEEKSYTHPELLSISEKTQNKLKQVIFKMLSQVGILSDTENKVIIKPFLNENILKMIYSDDPFWLKGFLYSDLELKYLN